MSKAKSVEWITGYGQLYAVESEAGAICVPLWDAGSRWDHWDVSTSSYASASGKRGWPAVQDGRSAWVGVAVFNLGESRLLTVSYWLLVTLSLVGAMAWRAARGFRNDAARSGRCG